ncbi:universal stress protein [Blastopirellula sp. J2-11]|uniref:universal stress protein n=1 Tax=Blastopirellula sp. J2-11 TaxID=2943192 RepID=UPI0021C59C51|nr:universal stress protein [Blastopirellula sp. J2-11]UUO06044.1 universal stress protein [Blastopirellula sp. J2-11]
MKMNKILFPTDFSHCGDAAMRLATAIAKDFGATIIIVHVEEPPTSYGGGEMYYGMMEPSLDEVKKMMHEVRPTDAAVPCVHRLISGDPPHAILRLAEEEKVDLIVMGTHGRTGFLHLLMGSNAETIVRKAKCPVLTFRQPDKVAE